MTVTRMVLALPLVDRYRARAEISAGARHRQRDQPGGGGLEPRPLQRRRVERGRGRLGAGGGGAEARGSTAGGAGSCRRQRGTVNTSSSGHSSALSIVSDPSRVSRARSGVGRPMAGGWGAGVRTGGASTVPRREIACKGSRGRWGGEGAALVAGVTVLSVSQGSRQSSRSSRSQSSFPSTQRPRPSRRRVALRPAPRRLARLPGRVPATPSTNSRPRLTHCSSRSSKPFPWTGGA
jgi:hypothetical protein